MSHHRRKIKYVHTNWRIYLETLRECTTSEEKAYLAQSYERAIADQIAYGNLMKKYNGIPICVECKSPYRDSWAFVSQDMDNPKYYRVYTFDQYGFRQFWTYSSLEEAVETMITAEFHQIDVGALDRMALTEKWAEGLFVATVRDLYFYESKKPGDYVDEVIASFAHTQPAEVAG